MEKRFGLIGYATIILPGLIIGYFFLIMNPPPDLLRYNDTLKMATTYHLSGAEILNHFTSISIFIMLFFFISIFLAMAIFRLLREEGKVTYVNISLLVFSVLLMGFISIPYYGVPLAMIMYPTGFVGLLLGAFSVSYPHTRGDYIGLFLLIATCFYVAIYTIADVKISLAWLLGFIVLFGLFAFWRAFEQKTIAAALRKLKKRIGAKIGLST